MRKEYFNLERGHRVSVTPVPAFLLERAQSRIPYPRIPMFIDEEGNEWENPGDPDYVAERQAVEARRISAAMMAAIVYGVELVDEEGQTVPPPDDGWERKLGFLGIDWRKPIDEASDVLGTDSDMEFARAASYLLYWCMTQTDIQNLMAHMSVGGEATATAEAAFPGGKTRNANRRVPAKHGKQS